MRYRRVSTDNDGDDKVVYEVVYLNTTDPRIVAMIALPKQTEMLDRMMVDIANRPAEDIFKDVRKRYINENVLLSLPRIKAKMEAKSIDSVMDDLGLETMYEPNSISELANLPMEVANVKHATLFALDEIGVEAAAATAVTGYVSMSAPPPALKFCCDRPHVIYLIDVPVVKTPNNFAEELTEDEQTAARNVTALFAMKVTGQQAFDLEAPEVTREAAETEGEEDDE